MSEHSSSQKPVDDEVDLGFIFTAIGRFFKKLLVGILRIFLFFYKHKWSLLIILIIGVVGGYFWDNFSNKTYKSKFIVSANYKSVDYLYNKVEALDSKVNQKDTIFLKEVFGENHDLLKRIEVEPIVNIYDFIAESETNADVFELLSEDEDMKEFIKAPVNSRNYEMHTLDMVIEGKKNHKVITDSFFSYLNENGFFNIEKEIYLSYASQQLEQNNKVIKQVDSIISSLTKTSNSGKFLISVNDENTIDVLLERKKSLLGNNRYLISLLENQKDIVTIVDANYALDYERNFNEKSKKVQLPILLISLYIIIFLLKYLKNKGASLFENLK